MKQVMRMAVTAPANTYKLSVAAVHQAEDSLIAVLQLTNCSDNAAQGAIVARADAAVSVDVAGKKSLPVRFVMDEQNQAAVKSSSLAIEFLSADALQALVAGKSTLATTPEVAKPGYMSRLKDLESDVLAGKHNTFFAYGAAAAAAVAAVAATAVVAVSKYNNSK